MALNRGWWVAFVLAPVAVLGEGTARADAVALPHGVHLTSTGRYIQDVCDHDQRFYCMAHRLLPPTYKPGDSIEEALRLHPAAGSQGMGPTDVVSGYYLPAGSASNGKIVAVLDMPDSTALSDLNVYRQQYGLSALSACGGSGLPTGSGAPCFASVDESGGSVNQNIGDSAQSDGETGLDLDMISAACPDCSILLVQFTQASDQDFITSAATAARLGAVATSISWGGGEGGDPTGNQYTTPGHLVLAAAGDGGWQGGSYPASAPDVLAVGGTTLSPASNARGWSEIAWNGAGSGCSAYIAKPSWQPGNHCFMRTVADVSADADPNPGLAVYDTSFPRMIFV